MKQAEDLTGKKFGKLTVVSLRDMYYSKRGKIVRTWECLCDCGRTTVVNGVYLRRGQRTYCGHCEAPPWADAQHRICRRCEWSEWDEERNEWRCSHGYKTALAKNKCGGYWCSEYDKLNGVKNRKSACIICGKPVYAHKQDAPIYCYEHRNESIHDQQILDEMPHELLFCLIQGIFERAREDYLTNAEGQKSDAEVFFRGEWAQILSMSEFDAEELIKQMDEEIQNGFERDREADD